MPPFDYFLRRFDACRIRLSYAILHLISSLRLMRRCFFSACWRRLFRRHFAMLERASSFFAMPLTIIYIFYFHLLDAITK